MKSFIAGVLVSSVGWAATGYVLGWFPAREEPIALATEVAPDAGIEEESAEPSRRRRRRNASRMNSEERASGSETNGDDLGENDARETFGEGGEQQLDNTEIERAMDEVFPRVRRCLVLAPPGESIQGRLVVRMRISGAGQVTRVSLSGPSSVSGGEAGACIQTTVRGLHLRSFDGPDMFVNYPITLE